MKMDVSMMLMNTMRRIRISSNDHIRQEICVHEADEDPCMAELLALVMNQGKFVPIHH